MASIKTAAPIVIDGVFFQIGRSGIARVWQSLLGLWAGTPFGDRLVVMDRARTAPRVAGIRYHDAPGLNYNDLEGDRRVVQDVCDDVGAALFMSTYYSYPQTTPSMAMVYDMIPEVMGYDLATPMWRQKREALAYAGSYTAISHSTARDLARFAGKPVDVRVDYTGSDFAPVSAEEVADFRRRHGIVRPYFMTSGSRADYKNAALFFSAFARFVARRRKRPYTAIVAAPATASSTLAGQAAAGAAFQVRIAIFGDYDLRCAYAGCVGAGVGVSTVKGLRPAGCSKAGGDMAGHHVQHVPRCRKWAATRCSSHRARRRRSAGRRGRSRRRACAGARGRAVRSPHGRDARSARRLPARGRAAVRGPARRGRR